jgi:hypothetical protein
MSKKTCKREKCKYFRGDWGNDDMDYGCERNDETSICERQINDQYSIFDGYVPADKEDDE